MKKLSGESLSIINENIQALSRLFPEAVAEGKVNFDVLRQLLGDSVDVGQERYSFTWNGKSDALHISQTSSLGTLRPCKEESKNWDMTRNIYIEGDNLEVLKLLQKSYYGKVKMIYIDPPYNTGNDFVYRDDFKDSIDNYKNITGQIDGNERNISTTPEKEGRFHTDWLNMIYPRLRLARNLLTEDGVIFISIDDHEQANLKKVCDEIFWENNFLGNITVVGNPRGRDYGGIARMHDYILVYQKSSVQKLNLIIDEENEFKSFDFLGGFELRELRNRNIKFNKGNRPNLYYPFYVDTQSSDENGLHKISLESEENWLELYPLESQGVKTVWRWGKEKSAENLNINIMAKPMKNGSYMIVEKYRESKKMARSVWWDKDTNTEKGTLLIKEIFDSKVFDYPKPMEMIKRILEMASKEDSIVMDFFSGSATTAHAVMQLNAEDGGNRKFIMVQLPELTPEDSEAAKAGYKNICEIGKERIRRAGEKIKAESGDEAPDLDIGFRVFKLDSFNLKKWNAQTEDIMQSLIDSLDNFLPGRTELDVVYEILLKMGIELSTEIEEREVIGEKIYIVDDGSLMICLGENITLAIADEITKLHKEYNSELWQVVFRDTGFVSDMDKTNIKETLKISGLKEDNFFCI